MSDIAQSLPSIIDYKMSWTIKFSYIKQSRVSPHQMIPILDIALNLG